ncbi:MAG: hypothetical protein PHQ23_09385 [Candidatus Wallbacteria bacterium]|nr:hypothetical protein [Candidatus Wallbacteria bacterium]
MTSRIFSILSMVLLLTVQVCAGDFIYFTCMEPAPVFSMDIFRMNPDGTGIERVTDLPGREWCPCITPDGETMFFVADHKAGTDIMRMNLTDRTLENVGSSWHEIFDLSISPDGDMLVFSAFDTVNPNNDFDIFTSDIDGGNQKRVVSNPGPDTLGRLNRGNTQIVYQSQTSKGYQVFLHTIDTGNSALLSKKDQCQAFSPVFTASGDNVVFARSDRNGPNGLFMMDLRGDGVVQIFRGQDGELNPSCSPDGKSVVFSVLHSCMKNQIFRVDLDGQNLSLLTDLSRFYMFPFWGR